MIVLKTALVLLPKASAIWFMLTPCRLILIYAARSLLKNGVRIVLLSLEEAYFKLICTLFVHVRKRTYVSIKTYYMSVLGHNILNINLAHNGL